MSRDRSAVADAAVVRDATLADVPGLERCLDRANHRKRVQAADGRSSRYLVVEVDRQVVAFARLVLAPPGDRPALPYLPKIVNLNVRPDMHSRGLGSLLIGEIERIARSAGCRVLHIGANTDNPRALALYQRLGFAPVDAPPAEGTPEFAEADRLRHAGVIYLSKPLIAQTDRS